MFGFRRARATMRLDAANRAFVKAYAARRAAEDQGDTRRMHEARTTLIGARAEQMAAELASAAVTPKPLHT
jgi:hypothetical protein